MNKHEFLTLSLAGVTLSPAIAAVAKIVDSVSLVDDEAFARDEIFWDRIRGSYKLRTDFINLENGFYCLMPEETLEHLVLHLRDINLVGIDGAGVHGCRITPNLFTTTGELNVLVAAIADRT